MHYPRHAHLGLNGPTFEMRTGSPMAVRWLNDLPRQHLLPIDHTLHGAELTWPEVRTVVHLHGAKVLPDSDGHPEAWFTNGFAETGPSFSTRVYHYPNDQAATMLWYHEVEPRKYRFRMLNACNARFLHLTLVDSEGRRLTFRQIGADQGFLPKPVGVVDLLMRPAERYDVVVDFRAETGKSFNRQPFDLNVFQSTGEIKFLGPPEAPALNERRAWKDVAKVFPGNPDNGIGSLTRIIQTFELPRGASIPPGQVLPYVWHCRPAGHARHGARTGSPGGLTAVLATAAPVDVASLLAQGFIVKEIARRTERVGRILHVFSTYEVRHAVSDLTPFVHGVNSFHLLFDGGRWWIFDVLWQPEATRPLTRSATPPDPR